MANYVEILSDPIKAPTLSYRQVSDALERARIVEPWAKDIDLEAFAGQMNQRTGSRAFDQGLDESWIKDASIGVDRFLETAALPEYGGKLGGAVGEVLGSREGGERAGAAIPRTLTNLTPALVTGGLGGLPALLGLLGTGAAAGSGAYAETGSPGQAALTGTLAAATPVVGRAASSAIGNWLAGRAGTLFGETLAQRASQVAASQLAMGTFMEGGYQIPRLLSGEGLDFSREHLVEQAVGQAAFLPLDVPTLLARPSAQQIAAHRTLQREQASKAFGAHIEDYRARAESDANALYDLLRPRTTVTTEPRTTGPESLPLMNEPTPPVPRTGLRPQPLSTGVEDLLGPVGPAQARAQAQPKKSLFMEPIVDPVRYSEQNIMGPQRFGIASYGDPATPKPKVSATPAKLEEAQTALRATATEPDMIKSVKQVQKMYEQMRSVAKVQDVTLDNLDDGVLRTKIQEQLDKGADLGDAVMRVTSGLRETFDNAIEARKRQYGASNKLMTADKLAALREKARMSAMGQTNLPVFGITTDQAQYIIALGTYHAEALVRAGALRFEDWIETLRSDPDAAKVTDDQARKLWNVVLRDLNIGGESRTRTSQTERAEVAATKLQQIEDAWRQQQMALPMQQRDEASNPLVRLDRLRRQVLRRHKYLQKYPRVTEDMIVGMATADLSRSDTELVGYLTTIARNAAKMELRQITPEERQVGQDYATEQEAYTALEEINRGLSTDSAEEAFVKPASKNGPWQTWVRTKATRSLDDRFGTGVDEARRADEEAEIETGETRESADATPDDEGGPIVLNDDGEVTDTFADIDQQIEQASLSSETKETLQSAVDDIWSAVQQRVDPVEFAVRGIKNPVIFAERVKVMLEYFRDQRTTVGEKDVSELMHRMRDAGVPFDNDQQLIAWYSKKGAFYDHIMGKSGWLAQQPEVLQLVATREGRFETQTGQQPAKEAPLTRVQRRAKEMRELGGNPDAVGSGAGVNMRGTAVPPEYWNPSTPRAFVMTALSFGQKLAARMGLSKEGQVEFANRLARVAAVWKATDRMRMTSLEGTYDWGAAITSMSPEWRGIAAINERFFPVREAEMWQKGFTIGHEGFHQVQMAALRGELTPTERAAYNEMMAMSDSMDQSQRLDFLRAAFKESLPDEIWSKIRADKEAMRQVLQLLDYSSQTSKEFSATMAGLYALAASEPTKGVSRANDMLTYMDGTIGRFIQLVFRKASEFAQGMKALFAGNDLGLIKGLDQTYGPDAALDKFTDAFGKLARTPDEVTEAVTALRNMEQMLPDQYATALARNTVPPYRSVRTGDADVDATLQDFRARVLPPDDPNDVNKFVSYASDVAQLVEAHPKLRPILAESYAYQARAETASERLMSPFYERDGTGGGVRIKGPAKDLETITRSPDESRALTERMLLEQEYERFLEPAEEQALAAKYRLTSEQMTRLSNVRNAFSMSNQEAAGLIQRFARNGMEHLAASTILNELPGPYKDAVNAAEAIVTNQLGTPVNLAGLGLPPAVLAKAVESVNAVMPAFQKLQKQLTDRPWFVTEQRYGPFHVSYKQAGQTLRGRQSAKTQSEFNNLVERLRKNSSISDIRTFESSPDDYAGFSKTVSDTFKELEQAAYQRALSTLPKDVADQVRETYAVGNAVDKELAARGLGKLNQRRTLAPGRESLDMIQQNLDYMTTLPYALAKNWLKERQRVVLADQDFKANPTYERVGRQQFEKMLANGTRLENAVKAGTFYYYLGGNLSTAMLELTQPLQVLPAQLTQDGFGVAEGYKTVAKAATAVAKAFGTKKYDDPWIDKMMHRLELNRVVDKGFLSKLFDHNELNYINLKRTSSGRGALDYATAAAKPLSWLASSWRNLYGQVTSATTRISAVTALMLAKQRGMSDDAAYDYAQRIVGLTAPGSGGRVTQSIGLGTDGQFLSRSAKSMLTALQSYTISTLSATARVLHDAVQSKSLTSQQSKAAMQLLTTQFVMAGALGLPGVGIAVGLVNQMFPQFEVKRRMRETFAKLAGDDEELGYFVSNLAMRGLPTAVSPVDASARLGMSSLLGVSAYDGFQIKDLLGAPGGVAGSLWEGVSQANAGDLGQAFQTAAPTALRNILRVFRGGGEVRDKEGNLVFSPSAAEQFAQTIGFTPKRLADVREYQQLSRQADEVAANEQDVFLDRVADFIDEGKFQEARAALIDREVKNPTEFSAVEGLKLAVKRAQDRHVPRDITAGGRKASSLEREALARTYMLRPPANEAARLQQRKQLEMQAGYYAPSSSSDILEATMLDRVLSENPGISRREAMRRVDRILGRRRDSL